MFNIDQKKTGSINDGGRKLKVGAYPYKITGAKLDPVKSDPTGRERQVVFDLLNGDDYHCKVFINVMSANAVQREIAEKTLVAFAAAAGIGGNLKPERLPSFVGKTVVVEARETQGKGENKDKTYVNISTVEAYDGEEEPPAEEEEEEEVPVAAAPPAKKKAAPAKPAPAAASPPWGAPEEDDDEEE